MQRIKPLNVVLIAVAFLMVSAAMYLQWQHSRARIYSSVRLAMAVESYSRDYALRGQRLPSSVTFRDLVNGRYISVREVRTFKGMTVAMYPSISTDPRTVLVRVRTPDGVQFAAMLDGSVKQETRK